MEGLRPGEAGGGVGEAGVNQAELRQMAEERIRDAEALLAAGRWEFAYYAAGYAVECGLKSCLLARMIHTAWVFQEKWDAKTCLTHDFGKLIDLARLRDELNNKLAAPGSVFAAHWGTAIQWKVESRYQAKTEAEARALYEAITHVPDGVLPWIRNFW
jgi:HEPN domain-containing protein